MRYHPTMMMGGSSFHRGLPRRWGVLASVVLVHLGVLWWLQQGLSRESLPLITPITLISVPLDMPTPAKVTPPVPVPDRVASPPRPLQNPERVARSPSPAETVNPPPALIPAPSVPLAAVGPAEATVQPSSGVSANAQTPGVDASASSAGPAAVAVVQPASHADYLNNPKPDYPRLSQRLGEQGVVTLLVLVGVDGLPQKVEVKTSSGFERLDRAALDAVRQYRFVPGRRGNVPEAMPVIVPIVFKL